MRHSEVNENINKTISTRITGLENWADLAEENGQEKNQLRKMFSSLTNQAWRMLTSIFAALHFCSDFSIWRMTSGMEKQSLLRSICCSEKSCNWAFSTRLGRAICPQREYLQEIIKDKFVDSMFLIGADDCYCRSSGLLLFSILCTLNCLTTDFGLFFIY